MSASPGWTGGRGWTTPGSPDSGKGITHRTSDQGAKARNAMRQVHRKVVTDSSMYSLLITDLIHIMNNISLIRKTLLGIVVQIKILSFFSVDNMIFQYI